MLREDQSCEWFVGDDIPWIRSLTKLPLIIKGIQCLEVGDHSHSQVPLVLNICFTGRRTGFGTVQG
jgi:isopentenyl diphosphate isomerase/L-lactate dehydrogenase-like FMN-dependent dehydrogenase